MFLAETFPQSLYHKIKNGCILKSLSVWTSNYLTYRLTLWLKHLVYFSTPYEYTPSIPIRVYRSGRTCRIQISRSLLQPCGFEKTRSQKPLKKGQISSKMPKFERFFVSSSFKTWWSHLRPKNSNSTVSSQPVHPLWHLGDVLIVKSWWF